MSENKENEKLTFDREKGGKWIGRRVNKIRSRFVARNIYMKFIYPLLQSDLSKYYN